uniref:Uncharacterized protein n=1 Tax=Heterorhabditis bacteriophora TaxID=37862 RepID=A0A1I7WHG9_HETBA
MPSVRKEYSTLCLERCRISEYALRRFHEEMLDCRREIYAFEVKLQDEINVDRLLSALPNIERILERQWNLRNIRGEIMEIRIENDRYSCDAI